MLEIQTLIKDHLIDSALFPEKMIFTEDNVEELNNEFFKEIDSDDDKVAVLILSGGIQPDPPAGNKAQQRFKSLWQVSVVCPKKLAMGVGDAKMEAVAKSIMGVKLDRKFDRMKAVSDERGFNRPEYVVNLTYLPMMYSTGKVI